MQNVWGKSLPLVEACLHYTYIGRCIWLNALPQNVIAIGDIWITPFHKALEKQEFIMQEWNGHSNNHTFGYKYAKWTTYKTLSNSLQIVCSTNLSIATAIVNVYINNIEYIRLFHQWLSNCHSWNYHKQKNKYVRNNPDSGYALSDFIHGHLCFWRESSNVPLRILTLKLFVLTIIVIYLWVYRREAEWR